MSQGWKPAPKKVLGRLRECRVHFGTFDYAFYCVAGPRADLPAYVAWRHEENADWIVAGAALASGIYILNGNNKPIVWIERVPRSPADYGTLAHEVLHIVRHMCEWAGIHLNEDTQEVYCHALKHGVKTILTELRK